MVIINGVKYACDRCIRGHRVSGCRHVKEPLRKIKRKGRPSTQCGNCKKMRTKSAVANGPCSCGDPNELSSSELLGVNGKSSVLKSLPDRGILSSEIQTKSELTPEELGKLREHPGVKIELPDGSVLGPENNGDFDYQGPRSHFASHPTASAYTTRISASYHDPHYPPHLMSSNSHYLAEKVKGQHPLYGKMPGPYNADLYNDSMGNNEAAAVLNGRGVGGYAPNTGSVAFHPRMILESEFAASPQDLANSLTGIHDVRAPAGHAGENENIPDPYGMSMHITKLSNLY